MMKLLCEENNLEYTGGGYLQCGRHVNCPKKKNNKVLGFDCFAYVDNLPEGCKIDIPEEHLKEEIKINTDIADAGVEGIDEKKREKPVEQICKTIEYVVA